MTMEGPEEHNDLIGNTMFSLWDFVAVGVYFVLIIITGLLASFGPNRNTVAGYFLAGRFMWWLPVGASLFASNIGSEHFIGLAGSGAAGGIYVGAFELNALVLLQLLGWVFLPVFIASGVNTLPEYMSKRFGGRRIQTLLAVLSLLLYIITKVSVNMFSGAIFIQQAFGWSNLYISVSVIIAMTAFLTVVGGLTAVIYTDTLQFFIINFGAIFVAVKAFSAIGGYEHLKTKYLQAIPDVLIPNSTCGIPKVDSWVMLRDADPSSDSDMPWPAFLLGQTPASIWYWCADQMMVQRVMSARSISHAQGATLFAGFAKLLPLFVIVVPGMISRVLFPNEIGCIDPIECQKYCGSDSCTNFAYPKLVFSYMPTGMRGIMMAVMLSALISDMTSIFNSASTLFTMDIWSLFRPNTSEKKQVFVGRVFILVLVVLSFAWIPIIERTQGGELYIYIQGIAAYLSPPIAAIYLMAILWPRMNEQGAFWGIMSGFLFGIVRMILDFTLYPEPRCHEEDTRPAIVKNMHYMYFAVFLFWFTITVGAVVSLCTPKLPKWRIHRTTYRTRYDKQLREDDEKSSIKNNHIIEVNNDIQKRDHFHAENELALLPRTEGGPEVESDVSIEFGVSKKAEFGLRRHLRNILCGKPDSTAVKQAKEDEMKRHLQQLQNLDQDPCEKIFLNCILVVILSIAVFLYVYYSINPFTDEEVHELQREKIEEVLKMQLERAQNASIL